MLSQSPLHKCYRGHCFKHVTALAASRMLPQSRLQECYGGLASRTLPQSSLQECYCSHCFKQVTTGTTSRIEECDRSRLFRMLPRAPLQECFRGHPFMNVIAVAFYCSHRGHGLYTVTAAAATRMLLLPPLQESYCCHGFKNVIPRSPLQELVYFASRRRPHTVWGLLPGICFEGRPL